MLLCAGPKFQQGELPDRRMNVDDTGYLVLAETHTYCRSGQESLRSRSRMDPSLDSGQGGKSRMDNP